MSGSQINFTLWDFDLPQDEHGDLGLASDLPKPCHVYAIIKVCIIISMNWNLQKKLT